MTNEHGENDAQLTVALALGQVATAQIRREGDICPGARGMVLASTRDDIIAPETRAMVSTDSASTPQALTAADAERVTQLVTGLTEMLHALLEASDPDGARSRGGLWLPSSFRLRRRDPTEE